MSTSAVDFAIIAPVPLEHLIDGQDVASREVYVAFGSMKWELFRQIDELRKGQEVPVLIYPSHENLESKFSFKIAWTAWYIEHVYSDTGAHPDGMKYRPPSTEKYAGDNSGEWAIFWHVRDLHALAEDDQKPISSLTRHSSSNYRMDAPPRGPELVERPSWI